MWDFGLTRRLVAMMVNGWLTCDCLVASLLHHRPSAKPCWNTFKRFQFWGTCLGTFETNSWKIQGFFACCYSLIATWQLFFCFPVHCCEPPGLDVSSLCYCRRNRMRHLLSQKRCTTNNFETMISMIPFQFRTGWKALVIACFVFQCILVNAGSGAGSGAGS